MATKTQKKSALELAQEARQDLLNKISQHDKTDERRAATRAKLVEELEQLGVTVKKAKGSSTGRLKSWFKDKPKVPAQAAPQQPTQANQEVTQRRNWPSIIKRILLTAGVAFIGLVIAAVLAVILHWLFLDLAGLTHLTWLFMLVVLGLCFLAIILAYILVDRIFPKE